MTLNWKKLSNKQKTMRSVFVGGLAIVGCVIWQDDILEFRNGKGAWLLAICYIGFTLQALFYGIKWRKELRQ